MERRHVLQIFFDRGSRRRTEQTASVRNGFPVTEGPLFFEIVSIFVVVAFPVIVIIVVVFLFSFSFASSQRYQPGLFELRGLPRSPAPASTSRRLRFFFRLTQAPLYASLNRGDSAENFPC